ncbi:Arrestin (or s-antigen) n-terminal domain containing protein [Lasiodiplodia theobromae]|uniref:Arrestin (or s-antigen) n-terminal domain containing protein n=1 Tax=Lasiodiplodia theobromae TaxID=45133 RepID=UPI0015C2CF2E|nr:Arrestin (or s-antigen) n-terminal domain containing protein [Lasiodiplodia theobromae]KAF4533822.1 Arrestin (or s-antigen) n-terminal domain containing protein [Lasiodiplodia theobromae]
MLKLLRSSVHIPNGDESRPAQIVASDLKGFPKNTHPEATRNAMHLRIPKAPLTVVGDPCQADSVPLAGHIEVAAKPQQHQDITSIQLALLRTTKIKKQSTKPQDALSLASRRRSFGNRSPTRDKRTCVEEIMQWTIAYSPPSNNDNSAAESSSSSPFASKQRRNLLPFNVRIPGHLPASTSTPVGSTIYTLTATALSRTTPSKPLFKTETPVTLRRALLLPQGPAEVSLRRRFPDSQMSTRLSLPGVLRPSGGDEFTAKLTLCNSISRRGRTTTRLAVRRLDWRIEERAQLVPVAEAGRLPPFAETETGATNSESSSPQQTQKKKDAQHHQHVRKLASGGWTGNLDKLPTPAPGSGDVEVAFNVALPASAKASCGVEPDTLSSAPSNGGNSGGGDDANANAADNNNDNRVALSVSHVLVLELITAELKHNADTGELVNMYPFPQRKFGAVYDITVSNWDYTTDFAAGLASVPVTPGILTPDGNNEQRDSYFDAATPPSSTSFPPTIPPYCDIFGEMPPSYDSVAVM